MAWKPLPQQFPALAMPLAIVFHAPLRADDPPVGTSPFADWAMANDLPGVGPEIDSDGDGIANGIEFVIGGDPSGPDSNSNHLLPTVTTDSNYLSLTYFLTDDAAGMPEGETPYVEYGSDLVGWTPADPGVPEENPVVFDIESDEAPETPDVVTVRIPRVLADGAQLFARLRVDID